MQYFYADPSDLEQAKHAELDAQKKTLEALVPLLKEFGAHNDLLKLGRDFMRDFIRTRVKRKIVLHAICKKNPLNNQLHRRDARERRRISLYPERIGELYSSIATFEDKTLLVNLYHDVFAILIQNREVAETLKTIYKLARDKK